MAGASCLGVLSPIISAYEPQSQRSEWEDLRKTCSRVTDRSTPQRITKPLVSKTSTPRTLNHRPQLSALVIPRHVTQGSFTTETTYGTDRPDFSPLRNYIPTKTISLANHKYRSWSHTCSHGALIKRDNSEVEQYRRGSHQNKLFKFRLATPTPESVRKLTFDGSSEPASLPFGTKAELDIPVRILRSSLKSLLVSDYYL